MQTIVITKDLIAQHNLTDDEYKKIVEILGREPNITELGMFSVMWSEHCSYKSSRVHLKKLPTTGPSGGAGAGGKCRSGGYRRWALRGLQDGVAQPSLVHRALSGCSDWGRRNSPRHLYNGGAARLPCSMRCGSAGSIMRRTDIWSRVSCRASRGTATAWGCRRSGAKSSSTIFIRRIRS